MLLSARLAATMRTSKGLLRSLLITLAVVVKNGKIVVVPVLQLARQSTNQCHVLSNVLLDVSVQWEKY
jgi:hypothetical protein